MSITWSRDVASRFLGKAGFGATPPQLDLALSEGRQTTAERFLADDMVPTDALESRLAAGKFDFTTLDDTRYDLIFGLQRWWYLRMIFSPRQLEEKLTLFWHMHFATSAEKVDLAPLLYAQNQIFRRQGRGAFGDLLLAVSRDPAMLVWLDNAANHKDRPNENFAREVMELFTMGLDRYTQRDVTESARAYTGWTIDPNTYAFVFDATAHDGGPKTFLGNVDNFTGEDAIAILAARPETADFVSRKLARFFLGFDPSPALAERMRSAWLATSGTIRAVVREIFASADMDRALAAPQQVKTPTEFIVGTFRALQIETDASALPAFGSIAGQGLFFPPNVAGWPGGLRWMNTGSYLTRMNFADAVASARPGDGAPDFAWNTAQIFSTMNVRTADDLIDAVASRLGMAPPSGRTRAALAAYVGGSAGSPFAWTADVADRTGRGLLHLLLSSPEYQVQ